LFELTLTDPQLAPPSGESFFSMNNYLFIAFENTVFSLITKQNTTIGLFICSGRQLAFS
jgi:hypothetical protein